jgi:hypothetical protein
MHIIASMRPRSLVAAVASSACSLFALTGCAGDDTNVVPGGGGDGGVVHVEGGVEPDATVDATVPPTEAGADGGADGEAGAVIGALVSVSMPATVGVLLDEIPAADRDRVAAAVMKKPADFWTTRAHVQIRLSSLHLVFRAGYYPNQPRQQLPVPPESQWQIAFAPATDDAGAPIDAGGAPAPYRTTTTDGHDLVAVDYTFTSTILTDKDSPGISEPSLEGIGGLWNEPMVFPLDPELLVQRTGFACMNEAEFPPNSVDSEETDSFYDWQCGVEAAPSLTGCHDTQLPQISCMDALAAKIGSVSTQMTFTRLPWDLAVAAPVRVGPITDPSGADLQVIEEEFKSHRITYRYIPPDSCTLVEQCVGGTGWRRLLQFSTADKNTGTVPVDIGRVDYFVTDASTAPQDHHVFEYSACHHHWHFTHYGEFDYGDGGAPGNHKRGFCLQSTIRSLNIESSPTHNPYGDCTYQGIAAGWGDEYKAGLDCQWIDVTAYDTTQGPLTAPLSFHSNPDGFLCEGNPVLDDAGAQVWEPTAFKTDAGETVDRPKCNFDPGWDQNNQDSYDVTLPKSGEGFVTTPCVLGEIGPLRNCGFTKQSDVNACPVGTPKKLHCTVAAGSAPQTVRVCESTIALGAGVACKYNDALGNGVVTPAAAVDVAFTCPAARDVVEVGGKYSVYTAPVFPDDTLATVTCTLQ